jgi:ribosomal-protein-serine acetyltransferase
MNRPDAWSPPDPIPARFQTRRLIVRPYTPDDRDQLFRAIDESRESLLPWLPWASVTHTDPDDTAALIGRFNRIARTWPMIDEERDTIGYLWGVFERETGRLVGGTGLNRLVPGTATAETGYWVHTAHRRRGIATEALRASLSWSFMPQGEGGFGLRRIVIFAATVNTPSIGVPEKLGLRREQHTLKDRWVDGHGWCDSYGWGVLAEEWDCERMRLREGTQRPRRSAESAKKIQDLESEI